MSTGRSIRGRTTAIAVVLGFLTLLLPAVSNLRDGSIGAAGGGLSVSIGSSSIVVPAKGKVAIFFPVTLSRPSTSTVTVAYRTHDGTAKSGSVVRRERRSDQVHGRPEDRRHPDHGVRRCLGLRESPTEAAAASSP